MRWRELPRGARSYILYHALATPLTITWYMLPVYLFMTGYTILDVGILYTLVQVALIPLTYLVGRLFDRVALRHGLAAIDALEGVACLMYSAASGPLAPVFLFAGLLVDDLATVFYPLYQAAERILYPEERMEEALALHMRIPEFSLILGYLTLGFLFGRIFPSPHHYRIGFLSIGLASFGLVAYVLLALPRMGAEERISPGLSFSLDREFKVILLFEGLLALAWSLAPEIVMLNYIVNVLGLTLFEAMVVEAIMSVASISATYLVERIPRERGFLAMGLGYAMVSAWAAVMLLGPPFWAVVLAYFVARFGDVLAFPFYRAWIFRKVPEERASSILSVLSSYRRVIVVASPAVAGLLASLGPTTPYAASLALFLVTSSLMALGKRLTRA